MKNKALAILIFLCMLCVDVAQAADSARSEWMRGYVKMESGDRAMATGKGSDALEFYRGAQEIFEKVLRKYPTWNESLLNYRIKYCKEQIEKLGQAAGKASQTMQRDDLVKLTKEQSATLAKLNDEKKVLQSRVEVLAESLEKARGEAARQASIETSLAETTKQNSKLKEQLQLTELKLHEAEKDVARLKVEEGMAAELKKTEEKLKLITAQLEKVQKTLTETRIENETLSRLSKQQALALESLTRERDDQKLALQVVRELATARKKDNEGLLARFTTLEKKLADAELEIKAKDTSLAQSTQRVTQMLKEIDELHSLKTSEMEKARKKHSEELITLRASLEQLAANAADTKAGTNAAVKRKTLEVLASQLKTKDAEISRLASNMAALFADRERMMAQEEELAQLKQQLVEMTGERDRQRTIALTSQENYMTVKGNADRIQTQLNAAEARCATLAEELQNARRNRTEQQKDAISSQQELEALRGNLADATAQKTLLSTQLTEQVDLAKRMEGETKQLRAQLDAEIKKGEKAHETYRKNENALKDAQRQVEKDYKDKLATALAQTQAETVRCAALARKSAMADEQAKTLGAELDNVKKRLQDASAQLKERNAAFELQQKELFSLKAHDQELARREQDKQQMEAKNKQENIQALASAQVRMKQQNDKLTQRENELLALQKRFDVQASTLTQTVGALDELKGKFNDMQVKLKNSEGANASLTQQLKDSEQKARAFETELASSQKNATALEKKNAEMSDKVTAVDGMVKAVVEANALKDKSEAENRKLRQRITMFEGQLREADVKHRVLQKQLIDAQAKGSDAQSKQIRTLMEQLDKSEKRVKAMEDVLVEHEAEKQKASVTASLSRQISALTRMNDALQKQNKMLLAQAEEQAKIESAKQDQEARLTRMNEELQRQNKQLLAHASELEQKDSKLTNDIKKQNELLQESARKLDNSAQKEHDTMLNNKINSLTAALESLTAELDAEKAKNGTFESTAKNGENSGNQQLDLAKEHERRERETAALIRGYIHQGLDAERQGKIEAARWNYKKVLDMDSSNKIALQRMGQLAYNQGDDASAVRYLKQAFYHDPDDPETLFALGYSYARQNKPDWAVATMGRAVALNPENASMARVYGATLTQLGWTDAAEREFRRALKIDPKEKDAAFNLAVLLMTSASEKGLGLTGTIVKKLRDNSAPWLASRDTDTQKIVSATMDWLEFVARKADARTREARQWYKTARDNGVAPDPALEQKLK